MKIYKKRLLTQHAAFIYVYILNQNAVKRHCRPKKVCGKTFSGMLIDVSGGYASY